MKTHTLKWVEKTYINLSDNATTNMLLLFVMEILPTKLTNGKRREKILKKYCCFFFKKKKAQ